MVWQGTFLVSGLELRLTLTLTLKKEEIFFFEVTPKFMFVNSEFQISLEPDDGLQSISYQIKGNCILYQMSLTHLKHR